MPETADRHVRVAKPTRSYDASVGTMTLSSMHADLYLNNSICIPGRTPPYDWRHNFLLPRHRLLTALCHSHGGLHRVYLPHHLGNMKPPARCPRKNTYIPVAHNGLRIAHEILGLGPSTSPALADVVLVAIDFENTDGLRSTRFQKSSTRPLRSQVGLAILDTKELQHGTPGEAIKTHSFPTGSFRYVQNVRKRFLLGKTTRIAPLEIAYCIRSCIPSNRNVVIVGHGVANDLRVLQALNFHFDASPIVLDTAQIAQRSFNLELSLSHLLPVLGSSFRELHCAGNDANFTLRALLLLAVAGCTAEVQIQFQLQLDVLRQISTHPIPRPMLWQLKQLDVLQQVTARLTPRPRHWDTLPAHLEHLAMKPLPKKKPRWSRGRKAKARSWTVEKQDQIRAARRRERQEADELHKLGLGHDVFDGLLTVNAMIYSKIYEAADVRLH